MVAERIMEPGKRRSVVKEDPIMPKPLNAGNGFVEIGRHRFRPTHPLTQTGIESLPRKINSNQHPKH